MNHGKYLSRTTIPIPAHSGCPPKIASNDAQIQRIYKILLTILTHKEKTGKSRFDENRYATDKNTINGNVINTDRQIEQTMPLPDRINKTSLKYEQIHKSIRNSENAPPLSRTVSRILFRRGGGEESKQRCTEGG